MEKFDLHYKLTRLKKIFMRKDVESEYPHLYYHNIDSYNINNHNRIEKPDLSRLFGLKIDDSTMMYGRLKK